MPCYSRSYNVIQYAPVACTATVSIRHDCNHSAISFRARVQQLDSRNGFQSRPGGTGTKWSHAPYPSGASMTGHQTWIVRRHSPPQLSALHTVNPPALNRFKGEILRFAMSCSSSLISQTRARLGLRKKRQTLQRGRAEPFSRPTRHQSMRRSSSS
jgi:hypothetical protein